MDLTKELFPAQVIFTENDGTMSALAAQFSKNGKECLCFLRGRPRAEFCSELLCALAHVSPRKAEEGTCGDADWDCLFAAAVRLLRSRIRIDDACIRDEEIAARCKNFPSADVILISPLAKPHHL